MNEVNKTLYIPLYGKSLVSRKGIILHDEKAEEIWEKEGFELKGRSKSKWLAYNMAMRAKVFDDWTEAKLNEDPDAYRKMQISSYNNIYDMRSFPPHIFAPKLSFSGVQAYSPKIQLAIHLFLAFCQLISGTKRHIIVIAVKLSML